MPLFKTISSINSSQVFTKVLVWKITESVDELTNSLYLTNKSLMRLSSMKSEVHKKGFLCIRRMLMQCAILDKDLIYNETGKPFLKNGMHISISHSHHFATIAISTEDIGIDIEMQREKIIGISEKFCKVEFDYLQRENDKYVQQLTTIWCTKEAIFKIENQKGISFKDHIEVSELDKKNIKATLKFDKKTAIYNMQAIEIENFILVFGTKIL